MTCRWKRKAISPVVEAAPHLTKLRKLEVGKALGGTLEQRSSRIEVTSPIGRSCGRTFGESAGSPKPWFRLSTPIWCGHDALNQRGAGP
jgi:hypothetical protein